MYNPEKDFYRILLENLGKDGKSISALSKDLEAVGFKYHRLILTGYLRALTDLNVLKEREVPPSKIYQPIRTSAETIYDSVSNAARKVSRDPDQLILFTLFKLFKRPIFVSELKLAGVTRPIGIAASERDVAECKKVLRRSGNIVPSQDAVYPDAEYGQEYIDVLTEAMLDMKDVRYLVMETRQTRLPE